MTAARDGAAPTLDNFLLQFCTFTTRFSRVSSGSRPSLTTARGPTSRADHIFHLDTSMHLSREEVGKESTAAEPQQEIDDDRYAASCKGHGQGKRAMRA